MSYAIVGFGSIGQALAQAFSRSGIEVSVATTRDPVKGFNHLVAGVLDQDIVFDLGGGLIALPPMLDR